MVAALFIATTVAVGVAVSAVVYQWVGQSRAGEFAARPELENWTLPYLGAEQTAIPAGLAAAVLFAAAVLVVWGVRHLRADAHKMGA